MNAVKSNSIVFLFNLMVVNVLRKSSWYNQQLSIRLETKSCRILQLAHGTKYDMT